MDATLLFGAVLLSVANLVLALHEWAYYRKAMCGALAAAALSVLCTSAIQLEFLQRKAAGLMLPTDSARWIVMVVQAGAATVQFLTTFAEGAKLRERR